MYTPGVVSAAFRGSIVPQVARCLNSWFREANVCMHLAHLRLRSSPECSLRDISMTCLDVSVHVVPKGDGHAPELGECGLSAEELVEGLIDLRV
jgi:hypothetical protein